MKRNNTLLITLKAKKDKWEIENVKLVKNKYKIPKWIKKLFKKK